MSLSMHERELVEGKSWQLPKFRKSLVPSGVTEQYEGTAGSGVTDGKTTVFARHGLLIKPLREISPTCNNKQAAQHSGCCSTRSAR